MTKFTHYTVLVRTELESGDLSDMEGRIEEMLEPFDESKEVEQHKERISDEDVKTAMEYYKLPNTVASTLTSEQIKEYFGGEGGGKDKQGYFYWSTYNPEQYAIDLCVGVANPTSEGIGIGKGRKMDNTKRNAVLSPMWTDETTRRFSEGVKKQGRSLHILSNLHDGEKSHKNTRNAPTMDVETALRNNDGGMVADVQQPAGQMRDMQKAVQYGQADGQREHEKKTDVGSRPQSQDWEGSRAFMLQLQQSFGAIGGRLSLTRCNKIIPHKPHIMTETLIGGSKWDWYEVGGRWQGMLLLKPNALGVYHKKPNYGNDSLDIRERLKKEIGQSDTRVDIAFLKDVDLDGMEKAELESVTNDYYKAVDEIVEHLEKGGNFDEMVATLYFEYGIEDESLEERLARVGKFSTHAVVDKNGWHEWSKMGWWGVHSKEKETEQTWNANFRRRWLSNPTDKTAIAVVDVHI